mmetsp:Transcript_4659/g.9727  ORF Transcript_4659/g.9727 Transcript_4659/m.9727 type:complete len:94 (+) Transcript_4659:1974-2255(+)
MSGLEYLMVFEIMVLFNSSVNLIPTGTEKPCYTTCVSIVTKAALSEMRKPAVLALSLPVITGLLFRVIGSFSGDKMLGTEVWQIFLLSYSLGV